MIIDNLIQICLLILNFTLFIPLVILYNNYKFMKYNNFFNNSNDNINYITGYLFYLLKYLINYILGIFKNLNSFSSSLLVG